MRGGRTGALRAGRCSESSRTYLVTTATAGRERFLADRRVAALILDSIRWLEDQGRLHCLAAVVMPDHLHAVVELRVHPLSSVMHSLKSFTAKQVNSSLGRSGSVWQRQYQEAALRDDVAVRRAIRYCILNPVRAGLAAEPGRYPGCLSKFPLDSL